MLGLGWTEIMVIGVVALIFIGPKDLPVVMSKVGKVVGQIQRMGRDFQREINKTTGLDEVRSLRNSITNPLKQTADEIRKEFNAIGKDGQQKPSGALAPTDPKVESVADAIKEKAGMSPAKTSTELASEYGFKPKAAPEQPAAAPAPKAVNPKAATAKAAKPAVKRAAPAAKADAAPAAAKPAPKPRAKSGAAASKPVVDAAAAPKKPRAPRKKPAEPAEKS
ncbi:Sec-independent protein translocase protein TatB [Devosia faecipullorum]|uniref:Sec-independent protein translocase protein TatB n=1 Tax=Devosia faecipullorum TaxID=2755039 RepID=UPI00187B68F8|nr:Sec-independent protein translocase protein TatB [Devosia faecipullorum]MBE7731739.1 twin-arginine translocase subunit TatB [Devosia faecipullorum]